MRSRIIDKHNLLPALPEMDYVAVELGCGCRKAKPGAIGIDIIDSPAVDIVADVSQGLSFLPDGSVDAVYSTHVLEHFQDIGLVLTEIHRVLKPGAKVSGTVPHFSNPYYYSDYTHRTPFGLYTFSYFSDQTGYFRRVPRHYTGVTFKVKKLRVVFYSPFPAVNIIRKCCTILFNVSPLMQELYEGSFCYAFPAHEIEFELEK